MMGMDYGSPVDFSDPNDVRVKEIELVGAGRRVLDFGCSTGEMAAALKERGCRVTGIEIDPRAAERARASCERVIVADLDAIDLGSALQGERFDVALFGDVLEHLKHPGRLLVQARGLLAPGGFVVLSVPNITHASIRLMMLEGRFEYQDMGILDDTHLKYFTHRSIGDLLEASGYTVEVMDWVDLPVSEELVRGALDPLGLGNLEEVLRSFSTWESVAYQFVVRAFPAGEEDRVRKLSEDKVRVERRVRELEDELTRLHEVADLAEKKQSELEKAAVYARSLEDIVAQKDEHIRALEDRVAEGLRENAEQERRIEELEGRVAGLESGGSRRRRRR